MLADGDLVTIFDSSDLTNAIQYSNVLKLTIYQVPKAGKPKENTCSYMPPDALLSELRVIRDKANAILDIFEDSYKAHVSGSTAPVAAVANISERDKFTSSSKNPPVW